MSNDSNWQFDLEEYIREGEPGRAQRAENWQTAIGLQAVDGLATSAYLLDTAKEHIEGRIDIAEAKKRIHAYYEERADHDEAEGTKEADTVSARIAELLGEQAFTFSPVQLQTIHRRLFDEILLRAGKYRTYNITKKEWVLGGDTVYYSSFDSIADTLEYDFSQERKFDYRGLSETDIVHHIASFISGMWQIHPFAEGNTRTTAVFAIKYLRSLGYAVDNDPFEKNSWYFRNALVRANYENLEKGIHEDRRFLDAFFENLLLGASHELKNRYMHVDWTEQKTVQETSKETSETSKETGKEMRERILAILREAPTSTAVSVAKQVGLSPQGVRYHFELLKKAGAIYHDGPTKGGRWIVDE